MKRLIRYVLNHVPRKQIQRVVHFMLPVAGLAYAGRGVECAICGARYRKFMPYGYAQSRDNALCPGCLSLERHRLMWMFLENETDFFSRPAKLLHIAPEYCFIKRINDSKNIDYMTADLESPLAKVKMDVQQIPFADSTFDIIFCNHILEHVEDDRLAMRELHRVLRQGGWGVMLSPVNTQRETTYEDSSIISPQERLIHFGQKDHLRDYGLDFSIRLSDEGFEVEQIDYASRFTPEQQRKLGVRNEMIFLVRKVGV